MNRTEALHILGLEDDATADDIKIAYREQRRQILHPDKFAGNEKLQNRATEQFERLQEAYDLLTSGSGGGRSARAGRSSLVGRLVRPGYLIRRCPRLDRGRRWRGSGIPHRGRDQGAPRWHRAPPAPSWWPSATPSPMSAATAWPWRPLARWPRCFTIRRPFGILGMIAAVAGTATVWGIIQFLGAQRNLNTLNEHLAKLTEERKEYEALLEE